MSLNYICKAVIVSPWLLLLVLSRIMPTLYYLMEGYQGTNASFILNFIPLNMT